MRDEPIIQNRPKKKRRGPLNKNISLIIFVFIFLALIIALPYYLLIPKKETFKLREYDKVKVIQRDFLKTISASGTVVAAEQLVIKSKVTGVITEVFFKPGDIVKKGDLLVELASDKLVEDLKKAESEHQKKLQEIKQLELDFQRNLKQYSEDIKEAEEAYQKIKEKFPVWEKLYSLGEISKAQLEEEKKKVEDAFERIEDLKETRTYAIEKHQLSLEALEEVINSNKLSLEALKENLKNCKITAQMDGKIVNLPVKTGDLIQQGSIIAEIIDESSLVVQGEVFQNLIDDVDTGQRVNIKVGDNTYEGEVNFIAAITKESNVEIEVIFNEVPEELRPQTSVTLEIVTGLFEDCLALPRGPYLSSGMTRYVYRIEGRKAYKTEVTFGLINGNYIEVKSGLKKDDIIVASSYDNFLHLDEIELDLEGGREL